MKYYFTVEELLLRLRDIEDRARTGRSMENLRGPGTYNEQDDLTCRIDNRTLAGWLRAYIAHRVHLESN